MVEHLSESHPTVFLYIQLFFAEFFGTFILVFIGCASIVPKINGPTQLLIPALAFSFAILAAIHCFMGISGAHINPALTLAAVIMGKLKIIRAPVYFVAQMLGGIAAYGFLWVMTPEHLMKEDLGGGRFTYCCTPRKNEEIKIYHAIMAEAIATFILIMICGSAWDKRNEDKFDGVPARFGLSIVALILAIGHYTTCNMNPARSFGPALINWEWKDHYVYWVGPAIGSSLAAVIHRFLFDSDVVTQNEDE